MKQIINFSQFCDGFPDSYKDNFTYEGKKALFEYLESYEEETGEELEFDPIALCSEYTEYKDLKELQNCYPDIESLDELENYTQVIKIYDYKETELDNFIIQDY